MPLTYAEVRQSGDGNTDHQSWGPQLQILGMQFARPLFSIAKGTPVRNNYMDFPVEQISVDDFPTRWQDGEKANMVATDSADKRRNYCQIYQEGLPVGYGAQRTASEAGDNTVEYQLMIKGKKLMQQAQLVAFSREPSRAPVANTSGGGMGGFYSYLSTTHGTGGGGYDTATNVTKAVTNAAAPVTLTAAIVNDLLSDVIDEGGASDSEDDNTVLYAYSKNRVLRKLSAIDTNSERFLNIQGERLSDRIRVYDSEAGPTLKLMNNTKQKSYPIGSVDTYDLLMLNPLYLKLHYWWDWRQDGLGKTGLSNDYVISAGMTTSMNNDLYHCGAGNISVA